MAEFCLDCYNKFFSSSDENLTENDIISDLDLCEGCGEYKLCIIKIKEDYLHKVTKKRNTKWYSFLKKLSTRIFGKC